MHKKIQLNNGLTVVTQKLEGYKSISIGVWIKTGSSYENSTNNGISHFIEHMVFKGTHRFTAKEIASIIDGIGGEINAYTAKECTCFYTKTLSSDVHIALDILSDMMIAPTFLPEHIETEKTVIIDEINMYEDAAEEMVIDCLNEITFKGHPLSYPILGTKETVASFTQDQIIDYFKRYYQPENMVLAIAGNFEEDLLYDRIETYFGKLTASEVDAGQLIDEPKYNWNYASRKKDFEQLQVAISFPGIKFDHELSYEMMVLSNVLGGTNSSMLFQTVREERGLAYSIFSEPNFYDALGTLMISFGVSMENLEETLTLIAESIKTLKKHKVSAEALEHAKNHLRGSFFLNLEGSDNYMDMIGRIELFAHKEKSIDDMINKINHISIEGINTLIDACLDNDKVAFAIVGEIEPGQTETYYKHFLKVLNS